MKAIKIIGVGISFLLGISTLIFAQEHIIITTYYPSPYGSYAELRANKMAVGSNYNDSTITIPADSLIVQDKVGIGMTTPASYAALDVNTSSNKSIHTMDSANGGLLIGYAGSTIQARTTADANSQNLILQRWGGNVGIGTTSPGFKLEVAGDTRVGNTDARHYLKISSSEWPEIRYQTPNDDGTIRLGVAHANAGDTGYPLNTGDWYVYTSDLDAMPLVVTRGGDVGLVQNSGRVFIGTGGVYGGDTLLSVGSVGDTSTIYTEPLFSTSRGLLARTNYSDAPAIQATSSTVDSRAILAANTAQGDPTGGSQPAAIGASANGIMGIGVWGSGGDPTAGGPPPYGSGVAGTNITTYGRGVSGRVTGSNGVGVYGEADGGANGIGVFGIGLRDGVRGESASASGRGVVAYASNLGGLTYALIAQCNSPTGFAGRFVGNVEITGSLTKGSGSFDILHPNPAKEKQGWHLRHSFVESPNRGDNLYRWKVEVKNGETSIELPDYFKYLNENVQVWVSAQGHFGRAYGTLDNKLNKVMVKADSDGLYNVLVIGTRKDKHAKEFFDKLGVEYQKKESDGPSSKP